MILAYKFLMQKNTSPLNSLSDSALHEKVVSASKNEKHATLILLEYLTLVDSRQLFAVMGYSSLWEYVHKALQYSEAQTSERVNAVRLIKRAPKVKEELKTGALSLTSVSKLATHVKREKCDQNETLELLKAIVNKPTREVEKILAQESTEAPKPDQIKVVTKSTTRITIEVENEFLELMNKVKELGGYEGMQAQEIFKTSMRDFVKRREVKESVNYSVNKNNNYTESKLKQQRSDKTSTSTRAPEVKMAPEVKSEAKPVNESNDRIKSESRHEINASLEAVAENISKKSPEKYLHEYVNMLTETLKEKAELTSHSHSRYLSKSIKTKIRLRSKDQCEFISPITNKRCNSKTNLQLDHIRPYAVHGTSAEENLRHYCATHNRLVAIQFFGEEKMRGFLKAKDA